MYNKVANRKQSLLSPIRRYRLLPHEESYEEEEHHNKSYQIPHVLGARVVDHLSNFTNRVVDKIRRHVHAAPHLIEKRVLALHFGIYVDRKL